MSNFFSLERGCRSSEKSIPKTLKFSWDQISFIFGQIIWSEYFLFPTHTAFVLDEFNLIQLNGNFWKKPSQVLILDHLFVNGLNYSIQKPKVVL
jgi:hypothetical protein